MISHCIFGGFLRILNKTYQRFEIKTIMKEKKHSDY